MFFDFYYNWYKWTWLLLLDSSNWIDRECGCKCSYIHYSCYKRTREGETCLTCTKETSVQILGRGKRYNKQRSMCRVRNGKERHQMGRDRGRCRGVPRNVSKMGRAINTWIGDLREVSMGSHNGGSARSSPECIVDTHALSAVGYLLKISHEAHSSSVLSSTLQVCWRKGLRQWNCWLRYKETHCS